MQPGSHDRACDKVAQLRPKKKFARAGKNLSRDPRHRRHKVFSKMGMTLVAYWTYTYRADVLVKRACTCIYLAAVFQVHAQHGTCRSARTAWLSYGWLDKYHVIIRMAAQHAGKSLAMCFGAIVALSKVLKSVSRVTSLSFHQDRWLP